LTSIADTLEKVKKLREANSPPIPAEVITNTAHSANSNKKAQTTETTNVTPDKPTAQTEKDAKDGDIEVATPTTNETTTSKMKNDGFMTPNKKHVASFAALATSTMEGIETSNAYDPLKLQSVGATRGRNSSPGKDLSPSKWMRKRSKKNTAFMAALHNKLAQVDDLGLNEEQPGKIDASVKLFG
jgi:hypothetical protein